MAFQPRRVVTGHDADGKAIVVIDEHVKNVAPMRPGANASVLWTTKGFPIDNNDDTDGSARKVETSEGDGTVFRVIEYEPGVVRRNHRTLSLDYAVIVKGQICMELDDTEVVLSAGDLLIQRGTIHNWINRGPETCVIAFVLIGAKPVERGGNALDSVG